MSTNSQHINEHAFLADPQPDDTSAFDHLVGQEMQSLEIRAEARRRIDEREARRLFEPFAISSLAEIRARPPKPMHRIQGLIPARANTVITAPRKVGKTTFVVNAVWSLATGEPFLGRFEVRPISGVVVLLNFELDEDQLASWAAAVGVPDHKLYVVTLRGRHNPFRSGFELDQLATSLRKIGTEVIIPDPFARAFSGESENDTTAVARFLDGLDEFARSAVGAEDLIMPVHAGWAGGQERARGASSLEGWADSILNLLLADEKDVTSPRFMRAFGRDVDVTEDRLAFDPATRRLTLTGDGNRKRAVQEDKDRDLDTSTLQAIGDNSGCNLSTLITLLRGMGVRAGNTATSASVRRLEVRGLVHNDPGARGAWSLTRVQR